MIKQSMYSFDGFSFHQETAVEYFMSDDNFFWKKEIIYLSLI